MLVGAFDGPHADAGAVLGYALFGVLFEVLVTLRAQFSESAGECYGVVVQAPFFPES